MSTVGLHLYTLPFVSAHSYWPCINGNIKKKPGQIPQVIYHWEWDRPKQAEQGWALQPEALEVFTVFMWQSWALYFHCASLPHRHGEGLQHLSYDPKALTDSHKKKKKHFPLTQLSSSFLTKMETHCTAQHFLFFLNFKVTPWGFKPFQSQKSTLQDKYRAPAAVVMASVPYCLKQSKQKCSDCSTEPVGLSAIHVHIFIQQGFIR